MERLEVVWRGILPVRCDRDLKMLFGSRQQAKQSAKPISFMPRKPMVHANVCVDMDQPRVVSASHFTHPPRARVSFTVGSVKTASLLKSLPSLCTITLQVIRAIIL